MRYTPCWAIYWIWALAQSVTDAPQPGSSSFWAVGMNFARLHSLVELCCRGPYIVELNYVDPGCQGRLLWRSKVLSQRSWVVPKWFACIWIQVLISAIKVVYPKIRGNVSKIRGNVKAVCLTSRSGSFISELFHLDLLFSESWRIQIHSYSTIDLPA